MLQPPRFPATLQEMLLSRVYLWPLLLLFTLVTEGFAHLCVVSMSRTASEKIL